MDRLEKKEILQAVLIADNFNENFIPITNSTSISLLPLVNKPLLDYALEALNRSGVEEVLVFCSTFVDKLKKYIKQSILEKCSWSTQMSVQVIGSEGCRCLGDALRDLDGKGVIRGHFILTSVDAVTNAALGEIFEKHKRFCKFDKGAAMTVIYKKAGTEYRTGNEVVIAMDKDSNRLLFHQRLNPVQKERHFSIPLDIFLVNSDVIIRHDLIDPQIAICAPSVLPLFADNFDFESRDDFVRGLLINEEILASSIYVAELESEEYAARVHNWQTYQMVSNDVINRWVYPLVPDMSVSCLYQNYLFYRNNIYRSSDLQLARGSILKENVVIQEKCVIDDGSVLANCVVGSNCTIGKNCNIEAAFIFDNVTIEDNCTLTHCVIGNGAKILSGNKIEAGAVIGSDVVLTANQTIARLLVQSTEPSFDDLSEKLGDKAYTVSDPVDKCEVDSDDEDNNDQSNGFVRMSAVEFSSKNSVCTSSEEEESRAASPVQEDANIFLSEVLDTLNRGVEEKSNPEFLILEINSSRYAYNMTLSEVNFYVVKAILSLRHIAEADAANLISAINQALAHLSPVFKNYIRGDDAMMDCFKAIEECCQENENIRSKVAQIFHYLYNKEMVSEESILAFYGQLEDDSVWLQNALKKLVDWLEASSEEESD
ncbi:Translation initiation factor eIF-2B subunit epsilon [Pseudolycoriella hygida]|uniref:Translation initiation factor eIF2B subunit epsilon n=1 Tax=Pseudolycoriella hygida TaxID=35572 RepID=A0A9Q0NEM7_9DIPT|nr:Translation initiation factor eIF-2B subunit epsilon [Pseudolycoriella hygida]